MRTRRQMFTGRLKNVFNPESKIPSARRGLRHTTVDCSISRSAELCLNAAEIKPENQDSHLIAGMGTHEQVWVKVNGPVDAGVAQMVSALSSVNEIETLQSCQGDLQGQWGYVYFSLGIGVSSAEPKHRELLPWLLGSLGVGPVIVGKRAPRSGLL